MRSYHGEYKVPGGKLVVVDFEVPDAQSAAVTRAHGNKPLAPITNFKLSGDFFLEPDEALSIICAAVDGHDAHTEVGELATAISKQLPAQTQLIGFSAASVAIAVRRAITGASQWHSYDWRILHEPATSALMNVALDEVLTAEVGAGRRQPTLRFWEWNETAVIIGSFQSVSNEVDQTQLAARGGHLLRRISGGGAMYMEPENSITYALSVPGELVRGMSFAESYAFLDDWVLEALHSLGIRAQYRPLNDIASPEGKIGGAAQKRLASGAVLHHATMAYDIDAEAMTRVLRIGREKLSDKGTVSAQKRVDPLRRQTGLTRAAIITRMLETFTARYGGITDTVTEAEYHRAAQLIDEKFATREWLHRVP